MTARSLSPDSSGYHKAGEMAEHSESLQEIVDDRATFIAFPPRWYVMYLAMKSTVELTHIQTGVDDSQV